MSHPRNVAILWDYENCAIPATEPCYAIVNNIRKIAHAFGTVVVFNAYFEWPDQMSAKSQALRAELAMCGVSLVDCPHNSRKDVADKMILADMMAFALDNSAPATIILISGDGDFVYAVSKLRLRRYHVVLLAPSVTASGLRTQASVAYEWPGAVLPPLNLRIPQPRAPDVLAPRPSNRPPMDAVGEGIPSSSTTRVTSRPFSPVMASRANVVPEPALAEDPQGPVDLSTTPVTHLPAEDAQGDILGESFMAREQLTSPRSPVINDESLAPLVAPHNPSNGDALDVGAPTPSDTAERVTEDHFTSFFGGSADFRVPPWGHPSHLFASSPVVTAGPSRIDSPGWKTVARPIKAGTVPDEFKPLVRVLKRQRIEGITQLVFSQVGALLSQEMPPSIIYEKAGVTKLKEYIAAAESQQIVRLRKDSGIGDINVDVTISLHPRLCK